MHALSIQKTIHNTRKKAYPILILKLENELIWESKATQYDDMFVLSKNSHLTWQDRNILLFNKCERDNCRCCAIRNSTIVKYTGLCKSFYIHTLSIHEHCQIQNKLNASFMLSVLSIRIDVSSVPKISKTIRSVIFHSNVLFRPWLTLEVNPLRVVSYVSEGE